MINHQTQILERVHSASSSIKLAVSWLTDPVLLRKLTEKAQLGISVRVLLSGDDFNLTRYYDLKELENAGAVLRKTGSRNALDGNFMHAKLLIVDNKKAYGGSYNWTYNAQTNYEIFSEFAHPQELINQFNDWYAQSQPLLAGLTLQEVERRLKALELEYKEVTFRARVVSPNTTQIALEDHLKMLNQKRMKSDNLKSTAQSINNGTSTINAYGQAIQGTSGISSKPHRYHGGKRLTSLTSPQRHPFSVAHFQKHFINKHYSYLRTRIENNKLICRGQLQPIGCASYDISLEFASGFPPSVKILNLKEETTFDIHLYDCGSLCLYYPEGLKWTDYTKIAEYTIPWITEWIYFYEVWKLTGTWEGPESPAHN